MQRKKVTEKELIFDGRYKDFQDFFDINKEVIYKSIIEIFESFSKTKSKNQQTLKVAARIKGLDWDTKFDFKKSESIVLKRDIMPFFEEIEDYETCCLIRNIHKELTSK